MADSRYRVRKSGEFYILLRHFYKGRAVMIGKYSDRDRAYRACRTLNSEGKY